MGMYFSDKEKKQWAEVCKAYCRRHGYNLLFVNNYKFGFEDSRGNLFTMTVEDLIEALT